MLAVSLCTTLNHRLPFNPPIWVLMLLGAIVLLFTQHLSYLQAFESIQWDIIRYLFGVFILAEGLDQAGLLTRLSGYIAQICQTGVQVMYLIIYVMGFSSAILMNDTTAIIGAPIILKLTQTQPQLRTPLLLALTYAVTLGSIFSPVGNPQNLLIALHSPLKQPFLSFFKGLFFPTCLNISLMAGFIHGYYRKVLIQPLSISSLNNTPKSPISIDSSLCALILFLILMLVHIISELTQHPIPLSIDEIALISSTPILIFNSGRIKILKRIDWGTLIFFLSLFIVVHSIWETGWIQHQMVPLQTQLSKLPIILTLSVLFSQFISNVPLVALYLPVLSHLNASSNAYLALAAGSTLAGNILILGAASNIIIVQYFKKRKLEAFSCLTFTCIGLFLTPIHLWIYTLWLSI